MPGISGIEQLNIALDVIEKDPRTWNQSHWAQGSTESPCGTAYCLAGHLCILDGAVPEQPLTVPYWQDCGYESLGAYMDDVLSSEWNALTPQETLEMGLEVQDRTVSELKWPDGTIRSIETEAQRILGVDEETAARLFSGSNSFQDLKDMRDMLTERGGLRRLACLCTACQGT